MDRNHAHLSHDVETTRTVEARHGRPVIFQSNNGVWLTDTVPPQFLSLHASETN